MCVPSSPVLRRWLPSLRLRCAAVSAPHCLAMQRELAELVTAHEPASPSSTPQKADDKEKSGATRPTDSESPSTKPAASADESHAAEAASDDKKIREVWAVPWALSDGRYAPSEVRFRCGEGWDGMRCDEMG